jgi:hypothetical protein
MYIILQPNWECHLVSASSSFVLGSTGGGSRTAAQQPQDVVAHLQIVDPILFQQLVDNGFVKTLAFFDVRQFLRADSFYLFLFYHTIFIFYLFLILL